MNSIFSQIEHMFHPFFDGLIFGNVVLALRKFGHFSLFFFLSVAILLSPAVTSLLDNDDSDKTQLISLHGMGMGIVSPEKESSCLQSVMEKLEEQSEYPCRFTYSENNSRKVFWSNFGTSDMNEAKYAFGVDRIPLPSDLYENLTKTTTATILKDENENKNHVFHFPYSISALGLYYNTHFLLESDLMLNLTSDLIAKMFLGNITNWRNNIEFLNENPFLKRETFNVETVAMNNTATSAINIKIGYVTDPSMTQTWSEYLHQTTSNKNFWPKKLVDGEIDMSFFTTTKLLVASSVRELIEKMVKDVDKEKEDTLIIAFLPILEQEENEEKRLTEVSLQNRDGYYLTSSMVKKRNDGNLFYIPAGIMPNTTMDDFSSFHVNLISGLDTWPLLNVRYIIVRSDVILNPSMTNPSQRGLLLALLQSIYHHSYIDRYCNTKKRFYLYQYCYEHSVRDKLLNLAKSGLELLENLFKERQQQQKQHQDENNKNANFYEIFHREINDEIVIKTKYVLTEQRRSSFISDRTILQQQQSQNSINSLVYENRKLSNTFDNIIMSSFSLSLDNDNKQPSIVDVMNQDIKQLQKKLKDISEQILHLEKGNDNNNYPPPTAATGLHPPYYSSNIADDGSKVFTLYNRPSSTSKIEDDDINLSTSSFYDKNHANFDLTFTMLDEKHIKIALTLSSFAFALWSLSTFGRMWLYCLEE
mmetsp:Transcript_4885/g.5671  ORF Transcript_4885/g.5671 Transcript_4885/m.5671 type:complete len:702 (+) Transcript_4885:141-2246(+)